MGWSRRVQCCLVGCLVQFMGMTAYAMEPMADTELATVTGQALFVSDRIEASGTGSGATPTDFTFYRMGLDAELGMNANIDRLQLGCGGYNESLLSNACDIDMDFVRFMGRNGSNAGDPVTSEFVLQRPYISIAVKNDGSTTGREVVGIKVGAEEADGYVGIGRDYLNTNGTPSGATNEEHGGTCNATQGNGALACHSGINTISGYMYAEMSAQVPLTITFLGAPIANETACFGNTTSAISSDACGAADAYFTTIAGTRITEIDIQSIPLKLSGGFLSAIGISQGYGWITESLRFVHGFTLANTQDFYLSFQREQVGYPTYDKSGYAETANAGWWMNVPYVQVMDIQGAARTISTSQALNSLSEPGLHLTNIEMLQRPPDNCYGPALFC